MNPAQPSEISIIRAKVNHAAIPSLPRVLIFLNYPGRRFLTKIEARLQTEFTNNNDRLLAEIPEALVFVFVEIFDCMFIMSNFEQVAILFNCWSTSTKQQLLSMEVGKEALDPEYTFVDLFLTVCVLYVSPNHVALENNHIYQGVQQNPGKQHHSLQFK